MSDEIDVTDNPSKKRFEANVDGYLAVTNYIRNSSSITFTHTEVPEELRGRGIGNHLAHAALEAARAEGLSVVPLCPFVSAYIKRHPEYQSLVKTK